MSRFYVSDKDESVRMFKSNFMEALSKVHFSVPLFLYIPVIGFFMYKAIGVYGLSFLIIAAMLIFGVIAWSATEYILHRFVFHYHPTSTWGKKIHFMLHGVHHDYPNDSKRLVLPPSVSLPLAVLFYFLFLYLFGERLMAPFYSGFVAGYLFYDTTHYAIHHFNLKGKVWAAIKQHHMLHHYQQPDLGFGVSSPIWDLLFGTTFMASDGTKNGLLTEPGERIKTNPFSLQSTLTILGILVVCLGFNLLFADQRMEQLIFVGCCIAAFYAHDFTRRMVMAFLFFLIYTFAYDSLRVFPSYLVNPPVNISGPYNLELLLFGIPGPGGAMITLNEYFLTHTHAFFDVISGIFYLCWIPVPLIFGLYLWQKDKLTLQHFLFSFMLTNFIGFIIYYLYPAAPPWYVESYGFEENFNIPGSAAGLLNFDKFFGITLFEGMYTQGANVFGAIPSLHAAYPMVVLYYGVKKRLGKINLLFLLVTLGIWFAAVYTRHHYVIDVVLGGICAIFGVVLLEKVLLKTKMNNWLLTYSKRL